MKVGFVGLENIGLPMARNIVDAGFALTVFYLSPARDVPSFLTSALIARWP